MGFVRALRLPQIALLWVGQVFSAIGDYLYTIAVRTSGSDAGFVAGAQTLATFVFGLPGVSADRWNRHRVMITVDLVRAVSVLLLPLLALTGRLQLASVAWVRSLILPCRPVCQL